MCLVGVVVRRYIDFLILLIPTPLVSALFCSSILTFCSFLKCFIHMIGSENTFHVEKTQHIFILFMIIMGHLMFYILHFILLSLHVQK